MSITTRTPSPAASKWARAELERKQSNGRRWRKVFYWTASLIALLLLGIAIWELMGSYKAHKHQQLIDALKSNPSQIQAAVDDHQITDQEGWRLRGETEREEREKQMDTYFALKTPADRQAWMKDWINNEAERRAERRQMWAGAGPTSRPWNNGQNGQNAQAQSNNAAQRVARYESRDPNRAAQMRQFFSDMLGEMKLMGMPPPQFGGRRGH